MELSLINQNSLLMINVNILPSMNSVSNKTITFNSESDINREEQASYLLY